jgi:hypothetical protein
MNRTDVDRALGCSPCCCGDLETWHPECYAGKTTEQIAAAYARAYAIARREIGERARVAALVTLHRARS